jgi:hypothetical protein
MQDQGTTVSKKRYTTPPPGLFYYYYFIIYYLFSFFSFPPGLFHKAILQSGAHQPAVPAEEHARVVAVASPCCNTVRTSAMP